jgi:hypothetical protein
MIRRRMNTWTYIPRIGWRSEGKGRPACVCDWATQGPGEEEVKKKEVRALRWRDGGDWEVATARKEDERIVHRARLAYSSAIAPRLCFALLSMSCSPILLHGFPLSF